jgi:hypothetical protein
MGLLNKFTQQGTNLSPNDNRIPGQASNVGATKQSKLHAYGDTPGYSLDGSYYPDVHASDVMYDNGVVSPLPMPSQLDLNGASPVGYQPPEVGVPTNRLRDITG